MKKIKEYRMSLMEKDVKLSEEEGKVNYIIRNSAVLEVSKLLEEHTIEDYDEFVSSSSSLIFSELINKKGEQKVDSVGLWVTFEDGLEVDNSIDLSILEDIQKYGADDVDAISEFFKMTVQI